MTKTKLGERIRRYRNDKGMTLTELADASHVSKGYLSTLENGHHGPEPQRPSAKTLFAIANALGVTMADLLEDRNPNLYDVTTAISESLAEFAREEQIPETDLTMLAGIKFRDKQPHTVAGWRFIYESIRMTCKDD